MIRIGVLWLFIINLLYANEGEWSFSTIQNTNNSLQKYFDNAQAPDVYTDYECPKKGNGDCWPVIRDGSGKVIESFGSKASLSTLADGRYKDIAYLYYSVTYGKNTSYHLIDNRGRSYSDPSLPHDGFDARITKDRHVISITPKGIYHDNSLLLSAPAELEDGEVQNNLQGDIAVIARTEADEVITSNTKAWSISKTMLVHNGDKENILSVFPRNATTLVYAFYKYVNVYNKGIILGKADFTTKKDTSGWLLNSEKRNIGFDPEVFVDTSDIAHLIAQDSTDEHKVETTIAYKDIEKLEGFTPEHIKGFEKQKSFSFLVGTALSYLEWKAQNKVKGENDAFSAKLNYEIAANEFLSYYMQGRYNDTQLAVTYLQSKAKEQKGIQSAASKYLIGMLDFNKLFSKTSTLRIVMEKGKLNAIATLDEGGDANSVLNYNGSVGVTNEVTRYSLLVMQERGFFYGLDYTQFQMPSLLGFGKSGDVKFAVFDPKTKIKKYSIELGYDELSYAKRYETYLSRFYIQGLGGVGLGYIDYSSEVSATIHTRSNALGYDDVSSPLTFVFDGVLDIGYIYQNRVKFLHGLGLSSQIGIKARGTYYLSGSSSKSDDNDNKLTLEYDRYDLWYGPYVSLNLIF